MYDIIRTVSNPSQEDIKLMVKIESCRFHSNPQTESFWNSSCCWAKHVPPKRSDKPTITNIFKLFILLNFRFDIFF